MNWFKWPWVWSAAVVLPYLLWRFPYRSAAIPFPGVPQDVARDVPPSLRRKWIKLPNTLRFHALLLLIAAAAGPAWDPKATRQITNGMGIQIPPVKPETYFNLGLALYRMKQYAPASDAFSRAEKGSQGTPLEAASKLGQANCAYRLAIQESPPWYQQKLRRVLSTYEELSAIPDAEFNAEVVRRRLADAQRQSQGDLQTPSAKQMAFGPRDIVRQGDVPGGAGSQSVDKDW